MDPVLIDFMLRFLTNCVTLSTKRFLQLCWQQGVTENVACFHLYHLIANHRVGLDIDAPFTYDSELWLLPGALQRQPIQYTDRTLSLIAS